MPVKKCSNGKYRIGEGKCIYTSKDKADKAQAAYKASLKEEMDNDAKLTKDELIMILDGVIRRRAGFYLRDEPNYLSTDLKDITRKVYDSIIDDFRWDGKIVKATRAVDKFGLPYVRKIIKAADKDGSLQREAFVSNAIKEVLENA